MPAMLKFGLRLRFWLSSAVSPRTTAEDRDLDHDQWGLVLEAWATATVTPQVSAANTDDERAAAIQPAVTGTS